MIKQPTSVSHRIAMNTGILYAKMGISIFISLYTTRLILNALGASDFGIFNIVGGAIAMLGFLDAAMASATQRFMSFAEGEGKKEIQKSVFNVSIILHFFIALLVGIILLIAGYFFFNGILNIPPERIVAARLVYYFMIVSTLFTIMTVPYEAVLNAHENMLYYAIVGLIESALKLGVAIVVVYTLADKLVIYGILMAGISFFVMLIMRIYCHKKYEECEFNPKIYFEKELMKKMTGFAGWSFTRTTVIMLTNYGQGIVLNVFFGTVANAAQGIANQVCGQLSAFAGNMLKALNPVIAKSEGKGDRSLMLSASMTGTKIAFFLLMFFFIPVLIETSFIFKIWLTHTPDYTIIFCRLLFIRFLIEQLYTTLDASIAAVGTIRKFSIYQSVLTLFVLPIGYLLYSLDFPPYSLHIIFIITACISLVITILFAHRLCGLSVPVYLTQVVLRCVIPFLITTIISMLPLIFMESGFGRLLLVLLLNTITFLGTVWFYGFTHNERTNITQILKTGLKKIKLLK